MSGVGHTTNQNSRIRGWRMLGRQGSLFYFIFLIEVEFIFNVVLVSGVQQSDSVIHICILFHILFHYGLL